MTDGSVAMALYEATVHDAFMVYFGRSCSAPEVAESTKNDRFASTVPELQPCESCDKFRSLLGRLVDAPVCLSSRSERCHAASTGCSGRLDQYRHPAFASLLYH
jgi:hypothetical protein